RHGERRPDWLEWRHESVQCASSDADGRRNGPDAKSGAIRRAGSAEPAANVGRPSAADLMGGSLRTRLSASTRRRWLWRRPATVYRRATALWQPTAATAVYRRAAADGWLRRTAIAVALSVLPLRAA